MADALGPILPLRAGGEGKGGQRRLAVAVGHDADQTATVSGTDTVHKGVGVELVAGAQHAGGDLIDMHPRAVHIEDEIADEENADAPAEDFRREAEIGVHGEGGEADVGPVDRADQNEQRAGQDQPPQHLEAGVPLLVRIRPNHGDDPVVLLAALLAQADRHLGGGIVQRLDLVDLADAADRKERRALGHRLRLDHRDPPVPGERIAHERPVARFEDVQRQVQSGKQDRAGQREKG